ncbi:MAG: pyridoxamine 5'-phosphate oxidase family protein, partial [Gammaproteobacteria bacterium]
MLRPFDLKNTRYVSLATYRRDGREVRTPVWVAAAGDCHYVFSAGDAGKVKRLRVNPRVRLAACSLRGDIQSAW